jgi:DNA-binding beta-propeller fold protein YncE
MRTAPAALVVLAAAVAAGAATGTRAGHPQFPVGGFPTGIAVNPATHTVYVGNGTTASVSVIDGATCNAGATRGCRRHATAATGGTDPVGIAVEESTNTVYVVNAFGTLGVVDGRRCNAATSSGCKRPRATVPLGVRPQFLVVDESTHTIYVANVGSNTISVIDGRRCNALTTAGCRRARAEIPLGPGPFTLALNEATDSIYVTMLGGRTVGIVDRRRCNAAELGGCGRRPFTFKVSEAPGGIAISKATNTIYVTGQVTNDVSLIDGRTCNARVTRGCREELYRMAAGAGARGIAINERTGAIYVANTAAHTLSVFDGSTCNARIHSGCARPGAVAAVGLSPRRVAVDESTNTVYVTNAGSNSVSVVDGAACNGRVHRGCGGTTAPRPYTA